MAHGRGAARSSVSHARVKNPCREWRLPWHGFSTRADDAKVTDATNRPTGSTTMRILFFSSIFPRPHKPNLGIYCYHLCHALAAGGHAVRAVSPRSWLDRAKITPGAATPALPGLAYLPVDYPRYVYTPGVLRSSYAAFMWASVAGPLRRAIAGFKPDCVLSYW